MAGRKPLGPALVEHLNGSRSAKERLELILKTLGGQISVVAACRILDISEAMFYKLRNRVLQNCLEDLEPKPRGRPPQTTTEGQGHQAELLSELTTVRQELAAQSVRLELAHALPHVVKQASAGPLKKKISSREISKRWSPK